MTIKITNKNESIKNNNILDEEILIKKIVEFGNDEFQEKK